MLRNSPAASVAAATRPIETRRLRHVLSIANCWLERRRSRQALSQLDDRQLLDIGLTPSQAIAESAMPFWRPFIRLQKK